MRIYPHNCFGFIMFITCIGFGINAVLSDFPHDMCWWDSLLFAITLGHPFIAWTLAMFAMWGIVIYQPIKESE